jgi:hypothetical protein
VSARRWMEFLVPDALGVHIDWLRDLVRGEEGLLTQVTKSATARRLLTRSLHRHHELPVPERASLAPEQHWLLASHTRQVALARKLGIEALHDLIRTTVEAPLVAILRKALGDDAYREALTGPGLPVTGLERSGFGAALRRGRPEDYFVSVGAALLETTARSGDPFCRMRMRFAFSPACWRARPQDIGVDGAQLATRVAELSEAR